MIPNDDVVHRRCHFLSFEKHACCSATNADEELVQSISKKVAVPDDCIACFHKTLLFANAVGELEDWHFGRAKH